MTMTRFDVQPPESYFKDHELYDLERLRQHAEHNKVYVITSQRFPGIAMLHYRDDAAYDKDWGTFARMSRGLIVDLENRKIIAYPFNKFFNVGEMPETSYDTLIQSGEFEVSEKLDGSMLILFRHPQSGEYRLTTKGSLDSEHGEYATKLLPDFLKQPKFVEDYTLMFELIAKPYQIVVDYRKKGYPEGLYLIGVRERRSGGLLSYKGVQEFAHELGLPTMKLYQFPSLDALIENVKDLPVLEEGYVLRYQPDLLVKIKGTAYLKAHRFISRLSDKNLLEAVAEGIDKEMVEIAPEEYRDDVIAKVAYFKRRLREEIANCYSFFEKAPKDTRKEYALWVQKEVAPHLKGFMFSIFDHKPIDEKKMYGVIGELEKVSSETKI